MNVHEDINNEGLRNRLLPISQLKNNIGIQIARTMYLPLKDLLEHVVFDAIDSNL